MVRMLKAKKQELVKVVIPSSIPYLTSASRAVVLPQDKHVAGQWRDRVHDNTQL
ncbi:MAG: hypothetical protein ACP5LQ_09445 [Candidatus Methanodesulfokora sp.]